MKASTEPIDLENWNETKNDFLSLLKCIYLPFVLYSIVAANWWVGLWYPHNVLYTKINMWKWFTMLRRNSHWMVPTQTHNNNNTLTALIAFFKRNNINMKRFYFAATRFVCLINWLEVTKYVKCQYLYSGSCQLRLRILLDVVAAACVCCVSCCVKRRAVHPM